MIAPPLNDAECLGQLTQLASEGVQRDDVREVAGRFGTTRRLATWIRSLPQRDDTGGEADSGAPHVTCDVPQRARLVADDPNCVERSVLYVAAAERIDPRPVRQLATVDTPFGRHTFPVESGRPVVLDPRVSRNGLGAGLWAIRNGGGVEAVVADADTAELLEWVGDLAEEIAESWDGERGLARVERARRAFVALLGGKTIAPRDRADALFALRAATVAAPMFGAAGLYGVGLARARVARAAARLTGWKRQRADRRQGSGPRRNLSAAQVADAGARAVAHYYGVGPLYAAARAGLERLPAIRPPSVRLKAALPSPLVQIEVRPMVRVKARAAMVPPSLEALRKLRDGDS